MFSIDQNCHPLWDVIPKLQALAAQGRQVTHFVEDVDVAFTALGASIDDEVLHLARERFHRSGGQDWGAALFYSEFLGRLPVEIRHWEPLTGMKTKTLAKHTDATVDELYDAFSPGDTWQLIGSSYIGDRDHHRTIGDLSVREIRDFLVELFRRAEEHMLATFPQADSQQRLRDWWGEEEQRMERLLSRCADQRLVDLYQSWLAEYLPEDHVDIDLSSTLFATGADPARTALLEVFTRQYEQAARLYNAAIEDTDADLRPLDQKAGELPFYAILGDYQGHRVRCAAFLRDGELLLGSQSFPLAEDGRLPLDALADAGVEALAGKALLLVIQARLGPQGQPLALPHRGSLYMPTAHDLVTKLRQADLLPGELEPVVRVRFHLLDRLADVGTVIRLPEHLVPYFGNEEIPARELAANWQRISHEAAERLDALRNEQGRTAWQHEHFPDLTDQLDTNEQRRRQMAQGDTTPEKMNELWQKTKAIQKTLLQETLHQVARDWQARELDYWDSRGAILPWSIALVGEDFYRHLVADAELYEEPLPDACRGQSAS